jgi:hypothetical protein
MRYFRSQQYDMLKRVKGQLGMKMMSAVIYKKVPVFSKLVPEYFDRVDALQKMIKHRKSPVYLQTSQKKKAKEGLINMTLTLVGVLSAYHDEQSAELPEEALYTFSKLNRAGAEDLAKMCRKAIDAAREIPALNDYGLSKSDLNEAEAWLEEYTAVKSSPQLRRKEMAGQTETIESRIKDHIGFLEKRLDKMMHIATKDHLELNRRYFSARKVLPRGPGKIAEKEVRYRKSRKKASENQKAKSKKAAKKTGQ